MTHWLLVDVANLATRHFYAPGTDGSPLLALAGFFRGVGDLRFKFNTDDVAFCFDVGIPKRRNLRSTYKKAKHAHDSPENHESRALLQVALNDLRTEHLPALGFKNVFGVEGYEADDVIASLCKFDLGEFDRATIVSNDRDFWQLFGSGSAVGNIDIWNHKELLTERWFRDKFGIEPSQWAEVKAMAGDPSDCIYGLEMIGETKAVQFLNGELPKHHQAYKKIITDNTKKLVESNLELIELPFYGCPKFKLRPGGASEKKWKALYERLGIGGLV